MLAWVGLPCCPTYCPRGDRSFPNRRLRTLEYIFKEANGIASNSVLDEISVGPLCGRVNSVQKLRIGAFFWHKLDSDLNTIVFWDAKVYDQG